MLLTPSDIKIWKYNNLANITEMIWHIDPGTKTLEINQFWKLAFRIIETFKSWKWPIGRPPNVSNDCDQLNKLMKIVKRLMYNQTMHVSIIKPSRPSMPSSFQYGDRWGRTPIQLQPSPAPAPPYSNLRNCRTPHVQVKPSTYQKSSHKGQAYQAAFNMETVEAEPPIKGRRQGVSL